MPCDQVILNEVEIRAANIGLLTGAIKVLVDQWVLMLSQHGESSERGLAERIIREGVIRVPVGKEWLPDRIKQEYSRQAIQASARKFNWRIQESPRQKNKLTATRRV